MFQRYFDKIICNRVFCKEDGILLIHAELAMYYKHDWDKARERFEAFWNGETDRGVRAASGVYVVDIHADIQGNEVRKSRKILMMK